MRRPRWHLRIASAFSRTVAVTSGLAASIAAGSLLVACGGGGTQSVNQSLKGAVLASVPVSATAAGVTPFYQPPSPLPSQPAGALIREEQVTNVPGVPEGATTWRILYHSRTIYGADIAVSGYVVVPPGNPPAGGFPVISWAHGTTGYSQQCAPSLFNGFGGVGAPYLTPDLANYLAAGFEIAATDYPGLGAPGVHPYLLGNSEAMAVLDAARAAQYLPDSHASNTVIVYGHSQGGHAALFAGQIASAYAPDLHVQGIVAAAPATNLSLILENATTTLGATIMIFSIPTLFSWSETYHDLPITDLFTTHGASLAASLVNTGCLGQFNSSLVSLRVKPSQVFAPGVSTNPVVLAHARVNDPGRTRTPAPILVVQGTADTTVPALLTDSYVNDLACPMKDKIDYMHILGATHTTVVDQAEPPILSWMKARLASGGSTNKAPSTCGRPGDFTTYTPAVSP